MSIPFEIHAPAADKPEPLYTTLREGFQSAGYTRAALCAHLELRSFTELFEGRVLDAYSTLIDSPFTALCQVFILGRAVEPILLRSNLGDAFVDAAIEVGLLVPFTVEDVSALLATACLYPVEDLWIASDRIAQLPGSTDTKPRKDVVYPAATHSVENFLNLMPRLRYGRFLEACGGCGPAALLAGRFSDESIASDLEPRSAAFAAFNGRLQGLTNFHSIAGSYYEGAEGQFDCIAAHPPYMPSLDSVETYYGGGIDGSEVLRGLLSPLQEKLAPGGYFYAVSTVPRKENGSYTQQVRQWIAGDTSTLDVGVFVLSTFSMYMLSLSTAVKGNRGHSFQSRLLKAWQDLGYAEFALAAILVRRHDDETNATNCQRISTDSTTWEDLVYALHWEQRARQPETLAALMENPLGLPESFRIQSTHVAAEGALHSIQVRAQVEEAFKSEAAIEEWMSYLFARVDGEKTGTDLMVSLLEDGVLLPDTPPVQFAQLLASFVGAGLVASPVYAQLPESRGV